jgi:hypothetical protein
VLFTVFATRSKNQRQRVYLGVSQNQRVYLGVSQCGFDFDFNILTALKGWVGLAP